MKPRRVLNPRTSTDGKPISPPSPGNNQSPVGVLVVLVIGLIILGGIYISEKNDADPIKRQARKAEYEATAKRVREKKYEQEAKEYEAQKAAALRDALERIRQR